MVALGPSALRYPLVEEPNINKGYLEVGGSGS